MKKTVIISGVLICLSLTTYKAQINIGIKAPKFGKNKDEKKASDTSTSEGATNQTNKATSSKEEKKYFYTNYPDANYNNEVHVLEQVSIDVNGIELNLTAKVKGQTSGKTSNNGGLYYKESDTYYEINRKNQYLFIQADGSYLKTDRLGNANLISTDNNIIKNAPSKEELSTKAKSLVKKIESDKLAVIIAQNDAEFKKINLVSKNAKLESQFITALTKSDANLTQENKNTYKKVVLGSTDWYVFNNEIGLPIKQVYDITYIGEDASKQCFYGYGSMKKEHLGNGKYSDVIKFNQGSPFADGTYKKYISCDLIK